MEFAAPGLRDSYLQWPNLCTLFATIGAVPATTWMLSVNWVGSSSLLESDYRINGISLFRMSNAQRSGLSTEVEVEAPRSVSVVQLIPGLLSLLFPQHLKLGLLFSLHIYPLSKCRWPNMDERAWKNVLAFICHLRNRTTWELCITAHDLWIVVLSFAVLSWMASEWLSCSGRTPIKFRCFCRE